MSHDYSGPLEACGHIDMFIDVGPAKPNTEAWFVNAMFPKARIVGFEPYSPNYLACINTFPGDLYPYAVMDRHGSVAIGRVGPASIHSVHRTEQTVPCVTLDGFLGNLVEPNKRIVLWADVEGSELSVLRGATLLLEKQLFSSIVLEVRDDNQTELGESSWVLANDVIAFLNEFGYRIEAEWIRDPECNMRDILARPA